MPTHFTSTLRRSSHLALALGLALASACASQPKTIPTTKAPTASAPARSEAAPTTSQPTIIAPAASTSTQSRPLAPIAPAQTFSDGANRGLTPQPLAASAATPAIPVAATLREAGDRIFFMTDRYDLTDEARATLARQAAWISANPGKRVIIAGSADERGTREYNLALGSRRAAATRDYLVSLGVRAGAIETLSHGKERPIDARSNPDGWAINRNALTQLLD